MCYQVKQASILSGYLLNNIEGELMMTRDVEMEISLWEMFQVVARRWVLVLAVAILCAVAAGAVGYLRNSGSQVTDEEEQKDPVVEAEKAYEHDMQYYELYQDNQKLKEKMDEFNKGYAEKLHDRWDRLERLASEHPYIALDPESVTKERFTFSFEPKTGDHYNTLYDWLQSADEKELFGEAVGKLSEYKNDLIFVGGGTDEASFSLIEVEGFDTEKAAKYLKEYIAKKAEVAGVKILRISRSRVTVYDEGIANYKNGLVDQMNGIRDTLNNMYNVATAEDPAAAPTKPIKTIPNMGVGMKTLVKYGLVGGVLGLFLAAGLVIFLTLRKGAVLSQRQMDDTFGMEMLADCSKDTGVSADILNANLDVMIGADASVMLLGSFPDESGAAVNEFVSAWNGGDSSREFVAGRDIIDDSETIDALSGVEGILLGVRIGDSKLTDIQRVLLRAKRLGKGVLGYVMM